MGSEVERLSLRYDISAYRAWLNRVTRATGGRNPVVEVYAENYTPAGKDSLQEMISDQAKWGRDPWFLSAHMQSTVAKGILEGVIKPLYSTGYVNIRNGLKAVGESMLKAAKANYRNARNRRGRFSPVGQARSEIKANVGLDPRPMFARGSLYDSLRYRIKI